MDEDRPGRLTEIFIRASELEGYERARFLDEACRGDAELRAELETLLEHDLPTAALPVTPGTARLGNERIGPYRILGLLGEGGMGIVYQAEQTEPVRRRVALKVIKLGMDTRQVVARFEVERQALALMDHPNVARVLDAGSTAEGRPYFVMELVQGLPITEHCDRHRLTTRERLALFGRVCEGVQHAHQKAIIHRDLKPSNVLVAIHDKDAVPKIIDFGVAKATAQRLTERTVYTELGVMIGTPEYMSPEQADLTTQDVDTRTDVYSLGVMLYELLTGALPFDPEALRKAGFDEIRKRIREEDPPRPSARLVTLGDARTTTAARARRTELRRLVNDIRGDLDWIVMKALEKDRTRRYASPSELAADVVRHLRNEPVEAGPPSGVYRLRKFAVRHRGALLATTATVLALTGLAVTMGIQARRVAAERDRVRQERDRAENVVGFLADTLGSLDPEELNRLVHDHCVSVTEDLPGGDSSLPQREGLAGRVVGAAGSSRRQSVALRLLDEEILGKAALRIEGMLDGQPETAAEMHTVLAVTYRRLGLYEQATAHYGKAAEILGDALGTRHPSTLTSLHNAGLVSLHMPDRADRAEALLSDALEGRRLALGDDHPDTLASLSWVGYQLKWDRRFNKAEPYFREIVATRRRTLGDDHPLTIDSIESLGEFFETQGKPELAEPLYREALQRKRRILGGEASGTLASMDRLGRLLSELGKASEAVTILREALKTHGVATDDTQRLDDVVVVRVLKLKNVSTREIITLLRREVHLRRIAEVPLDKLVLGDSLERVDRSASLLRELGLLVDAVDAHRPYDVKGMKSVASESRTYHVSEIDERTVTIIVRAIYQVRDVVALPDTGGVTVRAPGTLLDSIGALLDRLGLLVEVDHSDIRESQTGEPNSVG